MSYAKCMQCDETYREPEMCPTCWGNAERKAIVAWLYLQPNNECQDAAKAINDGEHLKKTEKSG